MQEQSVVRDGYSINVSFDGSLSATPVKGCVHYIFASLFFKCKQEHLSK